jgi:MFS family permease
VTGANVAQALMVAGMLGFQFILPLYLRRVLHYSPAETGLAFLPITVAIAAVSLAAAPRLITRFGARAMLLASLPLLAIGLALLSQFSGHERYATGLMPLLVLLGIGAGLALPAVTTLAMSAASGEDSGVASGLANTTQQAGGAAGVAIVATLGYHLAFGVAAGLVVAALVVAAAVLTPRRRPRDLPPTPRTPAGRATARDAEGQTCPG